MEKTYLIINPGSASRKCALFVGEREVAHAHFETENGTLVLMLKLESGEEKNAISEEQFLNATKYFFELLKARGMTSVVDAIAVRVVAPGDYFLTHRIIDDEYLGHLRTVEEQAPLHIGPALKEIENIKRNFPNIPLTGISDSAFHATLSRPARHYALPKDTAHSLGIYRYGYHGISAESIVRQSGTVFGEVPSKTVICHLGSGSSIMAVHDGKSVDTSMGFTPLEGIIMATRVGDIDAGALIYLQKKLNMTPDMLNEFLNTKCGLFGVSGTSADTRELIASESAGDTNAALALEILVYRIKKYIGAYVAALNGIDALVFAGTIGERSYIMRSRICADMNYLGIRLDEAKNSTTISVNGVMHASDSRARIAVIMTDEMLEMARATMALIS